MKKILAGCLVCLSLVGCGKQSTPEDTVKGFMSNVNRGDINGALEYIDPVEKETFEKLMDMATRILGLGFDGSDLLSLGGLIDPDDLTHYDYSIEEVEVDGDQADVFVEMNEDSFWIHLSNIDGDWYIDENLFY